MSSVITVSGSRISDIFVPPSRRLTRGQGTHIFFSFPVAEEENLFVPLVSATLFEFATKQMRIALFFAIVRHK